MTNPKEVAHRLMGIPCRCDQCLHWIKAGEIVDTFMRKCECVKSYKYYDDGQHCEEFFPRVVGGSQNMTDPKKVAQRLMGLPIVGEVYRAVLQHWHTRGTHEVILRRVDAGDCEWRFADDGSELAYDWDVVSIEPFAGEPKHD